ncbi:MAG: hypothetical protein OEY85_07300, partial [Rhodospirillales bacterium]|nr:hypothetical protein [Rhodospirillales bacterium]
MMRKSIYMCIQLRRFLCVAALALLTACAPAGESIAVNVPAPDAAPAPAPDAFTVCHGFGCQFTSAVKLKPGS